MGLSRTELQQILKDKELTCDELDKYKNLDTVLTFKCKHNHIIEASFKTIRNPRFQCPECEGSKSISVWLNDKEPPAKTGTRVVGIDNATGNAGVSVFDDGKLIFYHCYHIEGDTIARLVKNRTILEDYIIKKWQADYVMVEDIQYQKNFNTYKVLAMLLGSTLCSLRKANVPFDTVLSKVWRAHFMINTDNRSSQKLASIAKVKQMYGLTVNDDIAEAILIGKYAVDSLARPKATRLF